MPVQRVAAINPVSAFRPVNDARLFVVTVAMNDDGARAHLLAMASVLHRRGVEVVDADLARPALGRRVFSATFRAETRQAETVLRTFHGLIDVVDASLFEALDARSIQIAPVPTMR